MYAGLRRTRVYKRIYTTVVHPWAKRHLPAACKAVRENTSQSRYDFLQKGDNGSLLQVILVTDEGVLVSRRRSTGELPESVFRPPTRQITIVARDPQWVRIEPVVVVGAGFPPICGGVDNGEAANSIIVGIGEIVDPFSH